MSRTTTWRCRRDWRSCEPPYGLDDLPDRLHAEQSSKGEYRPLVSDYTLHQFITWRRPIAQHAEQMIRDPYRDPAEIGWRAALYTDQPNGLINALLHAERPIVRGQLGLDLSRRT